MTDDRRTQNVRYQREPIARILILGVQDNRREERS